MDLLRRRTALVEARRERMLGTGVGNSHGETIVQGTDAQATDLPPHGVVAVLGSSPGCRHAPIGLKDRANVDPRLASEGHDVGIAIGRDHLTGVSRLTGNLGGSGQRSPDQSGNGRG
jgi:hypothetical protein